MNRPLPNYTDRCSWITLLRVNFSQFLASAHVIALFQCLLYLLNTKSAQMLNLNIWRVRLRSKPIEDAWKLWNYVVLNVGNSMERLLTLNHDSKLPRLHCWRLFSLTPYINGDLRRLLSKADFIGPAAEASDLSAVIHVNGRFCSGYLSFRLREFFCLMYDAQIS